MTTADLAHTISAAVQGSVWVRQTAEHTAADATSRADEDRAGWQRVIDGVLHEWEARRQLVDEDGIEWPAPAIVAIARKLASSLQSQEMRPPKRAVPSGEGGIVFEWQHEQELQTMEIEADGSIELCCFSETKLTSRSRLPTAAIE